MERSDPGTPSGVRILVVDDDPDIRGLVCEFLQRHGFLVEAAEDGPAMECALARTPADLVVLDVMLPGEDGPSLTRRLAAGPDTPFIILSAVGEDTDRIVGLDVGADDYIWGRDGLMHRRSRTAPMCKGPATTCYGPTSDPGRSHRA